MLDSFTAPDAFEQCWLLLRRREDVHRLADDLLGRIAEDPLCALVTTYNDAIEGLAYDCVITKLDNGSKPAGPLLTFAQRGLDLGAFNKVRGLSGKHIQRLQRTFRWLMRLAPVGGNHA